MKDPWLTGSVFCGIRCRTCGCDDRLRIVKRATPDQLRAIIAWPDTQKTVRLAAERRLRKLDHSHVPKARLDRTGTAGKEDGHGERT